MGAHDLTLVGSRDTSSVNFFGLEGNPSTTFTIVPEPSTALLLGLGLVALRGRRGSRR